MSEDFDKEAEREKLREKYEHDKQKREATEQMSELLLQGATMTNAHCSECSDPVFRYEGQEFCPTCEKPVDRGQSENGEEEGSNDDQIEVTTPSEEARVAFGESDEESADEGTSPQAPEANATPQTNRQSPQQSNEQSPQQPNRAPAQQQPTRSPQQQNAQPANQQRQPPVKSGEANVEGARTALVQTLTRFSQQAAATEDPQRAQEHLAAAREAAEALAELRR